MQHLCGRIAKSDVPRRTYVRTYASSTVSRHFGAETKNIYIVNIAVKTDWYIISYSYTTSCCGLSGIHEAVIQLEAEAQPRLLIE